MKLILGIIIILLRFYIGIQILKWIILEFQNPTLHSVSEIELYLVAILFDTWISISHKEIEVEIKKGEL